MPKTQTEAFLHCSTTWATMYKNNLWDREEGTVGSMEGDIWAVIQACWSLDVSRSERAFSCRVHRLAAYSSQSQCSHSVIKVRNTVSPHCALQNVPFLSGTLIGWRFCRCPGNGKRTPRAEVLRAHQQAHLSMSAVTMATRLRPSPVCPGLRLVVGCVYCSQRVLYLFRNEKKKTETKHLIVKVSLSGQPRNIEKDPASIKLQAYYYSTGDSFRTHHCILYKKSSVALTCYSKGETLSYFRL